MFNCHPSAIVLAMSGAVPPLWQPQLLAPPLVHPPWVLVSALRTLLLPLQTHPEARQGTAGGCWRLVREGGRWLAGWVEAARWWRLTISPIRITFSPRTRNKPKGTSPTLPLHIWRSTVCCRTTLAACVGTTMVRQSELGLNNCCFCCSCHVQN